MWEEARHEGPLHYMVPAEYDDRLVALCGYFASKGYIKHGEKTYCRRCLQKSGTNLNGAFF